MLAYILAVLVGTGSVGLYIAAFFFPEIHRKHDFIWSGVGFFYALFLWIYARQETGGILVGQTASVILLGWFAWQTLKLRRQLVPVNQQTPLPTSSKKLSEQIGLKQSAPTTTKPSAQTPASTQTQPTPVKSPPSVAPIPTPPAPPRSAPPPPPQPPRTATVRPPVSPSQTPPTPDKSTTVPQSSQPSNTNHTPEDEAWIVLEVKPAPSAPKSLGTPVQPPTAKPPSPDSDSSAIDMETISTNIAEDAIQAKAHLDLNDREG